MSDFDDEVSGKSPTHAAARQPLVVRVTDSDFQNEVLERLGRMEAKMDSIAGSYQPGRMKLAEDRLVALERNDLKRGVYDRLLNAVIAVAISMAIAFHDRWWK